MIVQWRGLQRQILCYPCFDKWLRYQNVILKLPAAHRDKLKSRINQAPISEIFRLNLLQPQFPNNLILVSSNAKLKPIAEMLLKFQIA